MFGIYLSYRRFDGRGVGLHLRKQTLYSRGRTIGLRAVKAIVRTKNS